jgi:riboflavin synthase
MVLTRFSTVDIGDNVNLEPDLCMGDALGGHWVSGHVDGLAKVLNIELIGEHKKFDFEVPQSLRQYVVQKGSITLNGVSLTVNGVEDNQFSVNLIPHTLAHTNLGGLQVGDVLNLETDLMGRYVERILQCNTEDKKQENT